MGKGEEAGRGEVSSGLNNIIHLKLCCALHVKLGRALCVKLGRVLNVKLAGAEAEVVEMQAMLPQHLQVQPIIEGLVQ